MFRRLFDMAQKQGSDDFITSAKKAMEESARAREEAIQRLAKAIDRSIDFEMIKTFQIAVDDQERDAGLR